jgi:hypothetical protein
MPNQLSCRDLITTSLRYRKDLSTSYTYTEHFSKDDVFSVEPRGLFGGDEELGSVGVLSGVGHGQPAGTEVLQLEVLIGEPFSIDGTATSA